MESNLLTHQVFNQSHQLNRENALEDDPILHEGLKKLAPWALSQVSEYASQMDSLEDLGFKANQYLPTLHTHNKYGFRIDEVRFHDAYHQLMQHAKTAGIHSLPWQNHKPGAQVARFALEYLHGQAEAGTCCPLSMTFAGLPLLHKNERLRNEWLPKALAFDYDFHNVPIAQKKSLTLGMAMTEKQGGSDVRANQTQAKPIQEDIFELTGHKWFCSAPMCDGFFVTALVDNQISCFLVPRFKEDGSKNGMHIMRLKDKLGNRANASSEVEFHQAQGYLVGEQGKGIQTIIEMVALTRFDCIVGSTALMRQAFVQATHHAMHRQAFGKALIEQPLMQNVLAHCLLEIEGAMQLSFRLAQALDDYENQAPLIRLATALGKYAVCKRAPTVIAELLECLGGAGYVEDFILARLYREAPLNAVWEGCGNIQCLDILRTMDKEPQALEMLYDEIEMCAHAFPIIQKSLMDLKGKRQEVSLAGARRWVESIARLYMTALICQKAPQEIIEASLHLLEHPFHGLGTLPEGPFKTIIQRGWPALI